MVQVKLLEAKIEALPVRNPIGRPQKLGLGKVYAKYRPSRPLGAPNKMGLGIPTKQLAGMASQIKKTPAYVFDHEPTAEEIASMPSITNIEAAARVLGIFDSLAACRDGKNVKNIAKRMK
jgi:hypothetical protein